MQEKYYIWLIFITVVLFAIIGLLFAKGNFLTGADVAEVSIDTLEEAAPDEQTTPSEEDEIKKKQEMIEESFKNATSQAIKDVSFISCVEVRLHKNLPPGALKGVVQKMVVKTNGHSETKVEGYPDRCSENGRKAIQNYCYNKQVLQREKNCETRCISGICV